MITLPNDCRCSEPAVYPDNWKTTSASVKKDWYIWYRFYCPEYPSGKKITLKGGINTLKKQVDRREMANTLLKSTLDKLLNGFNPVKLIIAPPPADGEITSQTPFCEALDLAKQRITVEPRTRDGIGNVLTHFERAARIMKLHKLPVEEVKKRHVKTILERVGETKKEKWTPNAFNTYRKYLSILFKELAELDAIDVNPIAGISKQKTIKKIRQTLTADERKTVDTYLKTTNRRFWLFTNIFFHSGARETEILKVKAKDVNLEDQYFKITVIKGSARREVLKTIKHVALPFWKEALTTPQKHGPAIPARPEQYVFGYRMKPNDKPISAHQVSKRWLKLKKALGITADFYSLKHTNSDEMAAYLGLNDTMEHNSHTHAGTTLTYTVNEHNRRAERIKKMPNTFSQ